MKTPIEAEAEAASEDTKNLEADNGSNVKDPAATAEGPAGSSKPKKKRASSKRKSRKPKSLPKRPMSAYNAFFKSERERMMEEQKDEPKEESHKVGFEKMGKIIGARWQSLSEEEREQYKVIAKEDMVRYRKEMKHHEEEQAKLNRVQREEAAKRKKAEEEAAEEVAKKRMKKSPELSPKQQDIDSSTNTAGNEFERKAPEAPKEMQMPSSLVAPSFAERLALSGQQLPPHMLGGDLRSSLLNLQSDNMLLNRLPSLGSGLPFQDVHAGLAYRDQLMNAPGLLGLHDQALLQQQFGAASQQQVLMNELRMLREQRLQEALLAQGAMGAHGLHAMGLGVPAGAMGQLGDTSQLQSELLRGFVGLQRGNPTDEGK